MSNSTKMARLLIATNDYLRRRAPNGARIVISHRQLAEELNCPPMMAETCLKQMARMKGSGVYGIANKQFEFRMPVAVPEELTALEQQFEGGQPKRSATQAAVLQFVKEHTGEVISLNEAHLALGLNRSSISRALIVLSKTGVIIVRTDIGRGMYEVPSLSTPAEAVPEPAPAPVPRPTPNDVAALGPKSRNVVPVRNPEPERWPDLLFQEVGRSSNGAVLVKGLNGECKGFIYTLKEL
jgi:hypothetical protein